MSRVVFAMTGAAHRNTRALRQLGALHASGRQVTVVSNSAAADVEELPFSAEARTVAMPAGGGPRFFWRWHRAMREGLSAITDADVVHASDLYVLPACARLAKRLGAKLVFDARELYPYVASTAGRPWASLLWFLVQDRSIREADQVYTVSDSIADRLADMHGIARPEVVHNVSVLPAPTSRTDTLRRELGLSDEVCIVLHQGQMRADRGNERLIEAMRTVEGAVLVFLGDGPLKPALQRLAEDLPKQVYFLPAVPPNELLDYTASADIGVTLLEDTCLNHRFALPNKLFEYLRAGVPVLASDLPEVAGVVTRFEVGRVADPGSTEDVARVLQSMIDDAPARAAWRANAPEVFETFDPDRVSKRFLDAYPA